jgi:hypothetical protein
MTEIHPDEIGMNASLTSLLVTGWVTYLDDLTHKLAFCDSLTPQYVLDTAQKTIDNFLDNSDIIAPDYNADKRKDMNSLNGVSRQ